MRDLLIGPHMTEQQMELTLQALRMSIRSVVNSEMEINMEKNGGTQFSANNLTDIVIKCLSIYSHTFVDIQSTAVVSTEIADAIEEERLKPKKREYNRKPVVEEIIEEEIIDTSEEEEYEEYEIF